MVSVQDQNMVYSMFQNWINFIWFVWCGEYYIQEVIGVGEIVVWVNKWLINGIFVIYCGYGWYF